jgi:hypothetical protein
MPRGQEFATVGHLYRGIERGLQRLTARFGESAVFVGSPRAQATPELFGGWPQVIAVTDLDSALAAVGEIIEQGEGARGDWQDAHYGRFLGMWEEYHAMRERDPSFEPARRVMPAYTHQPYDISEPQPVITDPLTHRVAELATVGYELVLQTLTRFFTHTDETDEQLGTLIGSAIDLMAGVVRPLGEAMTKLPVGPEYPGKTAGFAFEMYYTMGNFVPWREPAWALLHERASVFVQRCAAATDEHGEHDAVGEAARRAAAITESIRVHVPAAMLVGRLDVRLPALPRSRVGLPCRRRRAPVREARARGLSGRPLVADDPPQARGVQARVRGLRLRPRRAIR